MDLKCLNVNTVEAVTMTINAPAHTVFKVRHRVGLTAANGQPTGKSGEVNLTVTRETFQFAVQHLLDPDLEADGERIPLTTQHSETGQVVYWIG